MRANQFIIEAQDSDAVNELDLFIMNDEDLYRRRFMPIITNIKRKMKRGIYDHEKVIKLWMYLINDAAVKYVQQNPESGMDVKDVFPKETRLKVAQVIADREKENLEKGEYDVVKGIVSPRG